MARTTSHPPASKQVGLENRRSKCAACGGPARADYRARRSVVTLEAVVALKARVQVCHREGGALYLKAVCAQEEGRWVLPEHEFVKKLVRGVRPVERAVEQRDDTEARVVRGYCAAVRSALTDDHRPPLKPSGLQLHQRLESIEQSLERAQKGGLVPRR